MGMLQKERVQFCFEISEAGRGVKLLWPVHNEPFNGLHCSNVCFLCSFGAVAEAVFLVSFQALLKLSLGQLRVPPP